MFGKNLKYLREKRGLDQSDIADFLGRKSTSSISEWESGKYTPKAGVLHDIAKYFNVSLSDLMEKDLAADEKPTQDDEIAQLMEELHKNPDLRILMSTSSKVTAESLKALITLAQNMKERDD